MGLLSPRITREQFDRLVESVYRDTRNTYLNRESFANLSQDEVAFIVDQTLEDLGIDIEGSE